MSALHRWSLGVATLVVVFGLTRGVVAGVAVVNLDTTFSGTSPSGTPPWLVATFDDQADSIGSNGVRLTLSTSGLTDQEFVTGWYFNFEPTLDASLLSVTAVNTSAVSSWTSSTGNNAFQADGDGLFDLLFGFPTAKAGRFSAGETVVYDLSYTAPINVAAFQFSSVPKGGEGTFLSAAHVQGIGADANQSGWIGAAVPEPSSMTMLFWGLGLATAGAVFRRRHSVVRSTGREE